MTGVPSISIDAPDAVAALIRDFVDGRAELSGLDLYYELERVTPLLDFHTMLRVGPRNCARSGLQQSYGDHNRLLMLGLDKLVEGDIDWYRARLDPEDDVGADALIACLETSSSLDLSREALVALWLAAALHDCGMLRGRGADVDVEDGVAIAREPIDALCPEPYSDWAVTVLRHHDYIKSVFLGEVATSVVADDIEALPSALRGTAYAGLGLVQVAGAASLGEGRLSSFRLGIFDRCLAGNALDDRDTLTRLARLIGTTEETASPSTDTAAARLDALERGERELLESMLGAVSLHGWQRVTRGVTLPERMALLSALARCWVETGTDHLVLRVEQLDASTLADARTRVEVPLSGVRLLVVEF